MEFYWRRDSEVIIGGAEINLLLLSLEFVVGGDCVIGVGESLEYFCEYKFLYIFLPIETKVEFSHLDARHLRRRELHLWIL